MNTLKQGKQCKHPYIAEAIKVHAFSVDKPLS